jgi:16S rRNA (uracil1498-N3)-methyltransferase
MSIQKQTWTLISNNINENSKYLIINDNEHHYGYNVLRIKERTSIQVTNCRGIIAEGIITSANKKELVIDINSVRKIEKTKPNINLWLAMPKPTTLDEVIANSSEMGANQIHIFKSEKAASKAPIKLEKLIQLSNEATRISKSAYSSEIFCYDSLNHFYQEYVSKSNSKKIILFCDESHVYEGKITNSILNKIQENYKKSIEEICILIGPEASFSDNERELILNKLNVIPVSLGNNILRVPNASASALGVAISFVNDISNRE